MGIQIPEAIAQCLENYESDIQPLQEMDVAGRLLAAIPDNDSLTPEERKGVNAEVSAFRFSSRAGASDSTWGIYWSELASGVKQDGAPFFSPDISDVDDEILSYWMDRSEKCRHPVLQARYADLSWEIGRYLRAQAKRQGISGAAIPVTLCHRAIDSYLTCLEKSLFKSDYNAWVYIDRALELSLAIREKGRIKKSRDSLFVFADRQENEQSQWMWWRFEDILWSNAKALEVDESTRGEVIGLLKRILEKRSNYSDKEHFNPHEATSAADCLGRWLAQSNDLEAARQAIKTAALSFEEAAKHAGGMTAIAWLEDLLPRYRQAGMLEDAARIEQTIRQRVEDAQAEMGSFETSHEIKKDDLEPWASQFIAGTVNEGLNKVAGSFIVREKTTKDNLQKMCAEAPLLAMMPSSIMNADGFTVASVGSIEDDLDGRAIQHAATLFGWQSSWLHFAMERVKEHFSLDAKTLMGIIKASQIFVPRRHQLLEEGINAWLTRDAMKAIHILVPQIEAALRELLTALGGAVMIPDPEIGGFKAIGLGQVLSHPIFQEKMPKDIRFHLRVLYNDPRGLNVRNELAHGLISPELLDIGLANWVLHSVILLSSFRIVGNAA